jgi:hypothetical protein
MAPLQPGCTVAAPALYLHGRVVTPIRGPCGPDNGQDYLRDQQATIRPHRAKTPVGPFLWTLPPSGGGCFFFVPGGLFFLDAF